MPLYLDRPSSNADWTFVQQSILYLPILKQRQHFFHYFAIWKFYFQWRIHIQWISTTYLCLMIDSNKTIHTIFMSTAVITLKFHWNNLHWFMNQNLMNYLFWLKVTKLFNIEFDKTHVMKVLNDRQPSNCNLFQC